MFTLHFISKLDLIIFFNHCAFRKRFLNILRKATMMRLWKLNCFLRSLGRRICVPSEIAITQSSDTASATSKHCWGYREANDAALISHVFVNQKLATRSARPKSLISANGNSMFFGCAWNRTTDSILWSWKRSHQNGKLQKQKCFFRSL